MMDIFGGIFGGNSWNKAVLTHSELDIYLVLVGGLGGDDLHGRRWIRRRKRNERMEGKEEGGPIRNKNFGSAGPGGCRLVESQ